MNDVQRGEPLRIYYAHCPLFGTLIETATGPTGLPQLSQRWTDEIRRCADLGFSSLMISPPFATGPSGDPFAASDTTRLHPALGGGDALPALSALARACSAAGLQLLLDLPLARSARGSRLLADRGDWGLPGAVSPIIDPRHDPAQRDSIRLAWHDSAIRPALLDWASQWVAALLDAGVAGFRCVALDELPADAWRALIDGSRVEHPQARWLAFTVGLPVARVADYAGAGFDAAFCSLPWWNYRAQWLVDELQRLQGFGAIVAMPEMPFGPRLPRAVASATIGPAASGDASHRRALWACAAIGDHWLMPMGFEFGAESALTPTRGGPPDWLWLRDPTGEARVDLRDEIRSVNRWVAAESASLQGATFASLAAPGAPVTILSRTPAGTERRALVAAINPSVENPARVEADRILAQLRTPTARLSDVSAALAGSGGRGTATSRAAAPARAGTGSTAAVAAIGPSDEIVLDGADIKLMRTLPAEPIITAPPVNKVSDRRISAAAVESPRIAIEDMTPHNDRGRFIVRRVVGERVWVEADVWMDGHDQLAVALLWRPIDTKVWNEARMRPLGNDRWGGEFALDRLGVFEFTVEAWLDRMASWQVDHDKKVAAGLDVTLEIEEGRRLRRDPKVATERAFQVRYEPVQRLEAERLAARYASWYELFPRSLGKDEDTHGTFDDVITVLPKVREMGFDVLYFPPIHPIGRRHRKGRNNTLTPGPDDVGSPYAIGSSDGGHDATHPQLGTRADFKRLVDAAADNGLEIALDFAIQCAPDHPWLTEHPEWFVWRPDGTVKYAENPPKRYEDIVNVDFYAGAEGAAPALWRALRDVIESWIELGVTIFRVDNPHTKPLPFWEWMIADVRGRHPETMFLAEAFTRPKMMARLGKVGFGQSYTYFTWRNEKGELTEYMTELTRTQMAEYYRPHFFVNTPDINPFFLQRSGRPGFLIRAALATMLSSLWGVYAGFETLEATPHVINGVAREEYENSEKYQTRRWEPDKPGNIVAEITQLNAIRRANPALHSHLGLRFLAAYNDRILYFARFDAAESTQARPGDERPVGGFGTDQRLARFGRNVLLVMVTLDPYDTQHADFEVPLWEWGLPDNGSVRVDDLVTSETYVWQGKMQHIAMDPHRMPYRIWRVSPL